MSKIKTHPELKCLLIVDIGRNLETGGVKGKYAISNPAEPIRIKDLAKYQGVSESYLSKIFTKLVKTEILNSLPGVKGDYELAKSPQSISFWDRSLYLNAVI